MDKKELKAKAKHLQPFLQIGKQTITDNTIEHIKNYLKANKIGKIKFLKSALEQQDKKELANELAKKTNAEIIDQIGFVVVLYKR